MKTLSVWSLLLVLMANTASVVNADRKQIMDLINARKGHKSSDRSSGKATKSPKSPASSPRSKSTKSSNSPKSPKSTGTRSKSEKSSERTPSSDNASTPVQSPSTPVQSPVSVPEPVASPVQLPVATPLAPDNPTCVPTVGPCVTNSSDLSSALASAVDGSTIALCGDGQTITNTDAQVVTASDVTLCCVVDDCILQSDGSDSNLVVQGDSVTIQDITFIDGNSDDTDGGNVGIFGNGNHRIINSSFRNGIADTDVGGGNLYVKTEGTILIKNSEFIDGMSTEHGGGVAIGSATTVDIIDSIFMGNMAPMGGGLHVTRGSPGGSGMMITIEDSQFLGNSGGIGGGLLVTQLGTMPSLTILDTEFSDNTSDSNAAVGAIVEFLDNLDLELSGNSGDGNIAAQPQFCADFAAVQNADASAPLCIAVNENFQ